MKAFTPHPDLNKIDPEFRKAWALALRSSRQYTCALTNLNGAYCCLGVACAVAGFADEDMAPRLGNDPLSIAYPRPEWKASTGGAALPDIHAAVDANGDRYPFSILNDAELSHPQIADLLDGKTVTVEDSL